MKIDIGKTTTGKTIALRLDKANRHGLVTGATGTGKTISLQRMAEGFSAAGVPVFAADVKGDLSGIALPGETTGKARARARSLEAPWKATAFPVAFWDIFGKHGLPIRTSVQDMGDQLLSSMLRLNDTQAGTMAICFKKAEAEHGWMQTTEDLRWSLNEMLEEREEVCKAYGNITAASISAIQRNLLALEAQGGDKLFGEPPFQITDLIALDSQGRGVVNLLHADKLMEAPKLYATFLLWMLTELFRVLPEAGDLDKPKLVFFFDEAHLLFSDAPKPLLEQIERLVRLIRSKGVGVFFVTQTPKDVQDSVLAQLGNRIQHALRTFTPADRKLVKASADSFRPNPGVNVLASITEMGIGEALVSPLQKDGTPMPVERVMVLPPQAHIGPVSGLERQALIKSSAGWAMYGQAPSAKEQGYRFMRRMKTERGIDPGPDTGPSDADENFYKQFVPTYVDPAYSGETKTSVSNQLALAGRNFAWAAFFGLLSWGLFQLI